MADNASTFHAVKGCDYCIKNHGIAGTYH